MFRRSNRLAAALSFTASGAGCTCDDEAMTPAASPAMLLIENGRATGKRPGAVVRRARL